MNNSKEEELTNFSRKLSETKELLTKNLSADHYQDTDGLVKPWSKNWETWSLPADVLPIDRIIKKLIDGSHYGDLSIRREQDLSTEGIVCPYFFVRREIFEGVCISIERDAEFRILYKKNYTDDLVAFEKKAKKLLKLLNDVFEEKNRSLLINDILRNSNDFKIGITSINVEFPKEVIWNGNLNQIFMEYVKDIIEVSSENIKIFNERKANTKILERSFVLYMGQVWRILTGRIPTVNASGPFDRFVFACAESANIPDILDPDKVLNSIRTVIEEAGSKVGQDAFSRPSEAEVLVATLDKIFLNAMQMSDGWPKKHKLSFLERGDEDNANADDD